MRSGRIRRGLRRAGAVAAPLALAAAVTAGASGLLHIRIQPGDTLTAIAERYHTTVAALIALNHLPGNGNLIYAGSWLAVPAATGSGTGGSARYASRNASARYVVRPGDTLDGVAARFHVSPAAIARVNHLPRSLMIDIGQVLAIPRPAGARAGRAAPTHGIPPRPQSIAEVRTVIVDTARAYGVDPALALAISWQESGFNEAMISRTGAVGVMQIEPYTDRYVSEYLVGRPLDPAVLQDNVTAGVALLRELLRMSGSQRKAVAGYYQGLGSVRAHGMLPSTRQYVADVLSLEQRFAGA
jgi:LysM repeat protein